MAVSKINVKNLIVILLGLCLLLSSSCMTNRQMRKYLYPDGYIGWTRINFKKDALMPAIEDGAFIFKFTTTGELDISTEFLKGGGDYSITEFYYYTDDMQYQRISPTSAGSVNVQKKEDMDKGNYEQSQHYQFVGTYEEYQMYRDRFRDKDGNEIIGLMKREDLEKQ